MFATRRSVTIVVATAITPIAYLITAPTADADCTGSGGVTVCAQGEVRGSSGGSGGGSASPWYPYPCEYDYYCDDGGLSVILDPDIDRPDPPRVDNSLPGGRDGVGGGGRGGRR